jgi:uncharacterized protein YbjQ (UPF0145 family)
MRKILLAIIFLSIALASCYTPPKSEHYASSIVDWSDYAKVIEKDFEPLGFVTVTAERKGEDGELGVIVWYGENATYYKLIEEARKLGADAVINIVVEREIVEIPKKLMSAREYTSKDTATGLAIKYKSE